MRLRASYHIVFRAVGVALMCLFFTLTLGSRSVAFHEWAHGSEVTCCLVDRSGDANETNETDSDSSSREDWDPLCAFCRVGFLHEITLPELAPQRPPSPDLSRLSLPSIAARRVLSSGSPRAPPVSV